MQKRRVEEMVRRIASYTLFYRLVVEDSYSTLPQTSVWEVELLYEG